MGGLVTLGKVWWPYGGFGGPRAGLVAQGQFGYAMESLVAPGRIWWPQGQFGGPVGSLVATWGI